MNVNLSKEKSMTMNVQQIYVDKIKEFWLLVNVKLAHPTQENRIHKIVLLMYVIDNKLFFQLVNVLIVVYTKDHPKIKDHAYKLNVGKVKLSLKMQLAQGVLFSLKS